MEYELNDGKILIEEYSDYFENPRENGKYDSVLVIFHERYGYKENKTLHNWEDALEKLLGKKRKKIVDDEWIKSKGLGAKGGEEFANQMFDAGYIAMPIYMYEHTGICCSASYGNPYCDGGFDSGLAGFIYVSKENVRNNYKIKKIKKDIIEKVRNDLIEEVREFSLFLEGEVYDYTLKDIDGNEIDCYYGVLGDLDCNGILDCLGAELRQEA